MVVIQKRSHPRRALRKELFMEICGPLIPGLGNGTKYVILDDFTFFTEFFIRMFTWKKNLVSLGVGRVMSTRSWFMFYNFYQLEILTTL